MSISRGASLDLFTKQMHAGIAITQTTLMAEKPFTVHIIFVLISQRSNHPLLSQCHTGRESKRCCQTRNQI